MSHQDYETDGDNETAETKEDLKLSSIMAKLDYQQSITIDDANYEVLICTSGLDKGTKTPLYLLIIMGAGCEYRTQIKDLDREIDVLKNSFRKQQSLDFSAKFLLGGAQLEVKPVHSGGLFAFKECYILDKSAPDVSMTVLLDERVKALESKKPVIYKITEEMLGPCVSVTKEHRMMPDLVENHIIERIQLGPSSPIRKPLPHLIGMFYKIETIYSPNQVPVPTKNQILIKKLLRFSHDEKSIGSNGYASSMTHGYTLLTKLYDDRTIGLISYNQAGSTFTVNLGAYRFMANRACTVKSGTPQTQNQPYCSEAEYLKFGYVLTLPTCVTDGIYWQDTTPVLVKGGRLFAHMSYLRGEQMPRVESDEKGNATYSN